MNQERRKFLTMDRHEFLHGNELGNQAPRNDGLGSRRQMTAKKPSLLEFPVRLSLCKGRGGNNCRAGASPARLHLATGAVALEAVHRAQRTRCRGDYGSVTNKKAQRAKHTSDPIFPAPGTLLCAAFGERESATLLKLHCNSGHASAPPPPSENQRDYEQHKEHKEQEFRNAR